VSHIITLICHDDLNELCFASLYAAVLLFYGDFSEKVFFLKVTPTCPQYGHVIRWHSNVHSTTAINLHCDWHLPVVNRISLVNYSSTFSIKKLFNCKLRRSKHVFLSLFRNTCIMDNQENTFFKNARLNQLSWS